MVGYIVIGVVIVLLVAGIVRMQRPLPGWLQRWGESDGSRGTAREELYPGEDWVRLAQAEQRLLDASQDAQRNQGPGPQ